MRLKHASAIAICAVGLVAGCGDDENFRDAYYWRTNSGYVIELKGKRIGMAHDPITALMRRTYDSKLVLEVPRIQGVVSGKEIPVQPGWYKYLGQIDIAGERMVVDLYYDNTDQKRRDRVSWNGEYVLLELSAAHNLPVDWGAAR
jgi:hypothetical protein